ncbi:AcaC family transcriptional regulator [Vibrio orientalis CIP 102891 = ATCC 33934]|uniref:AcaC family transcriptional regulator n=1 Tax=Vibrio orientalis CIP 102891 = ATCC 33934 TaxID=675816 RepID=C9QKY3_VIBOR|nr:AraC family transcriptional regulator [Vibrio orientalis]EEX91463.1 transcriptional regulator AraC family [Vibrio orientalis CIP 102891 = ATCC 33934]EGU47442.1 AcaC family transcriptional regulator [Vibrio orientalis CIP 102891 = ATCC 33934]
MDVLHKGYWIGQSVTYVSKDIVRDIERYFHILDYGYDVSVLSEPDIHFCFFFYEEPFSSLFLTAAKLCQNLDKHIIIIHKHVLPAEIENLDIVFSTFSLSEGDARLWSDELNKQVYYHFTKHQEILDINRLTNQHSHKHISKDLVEMLRYIEKNLSRTIREEDVAEYCHYSVTYFSKFFHKTIGVSFRDYLTLKRINLAKQLLTNYRKEKISFIAFQCGYNDVSYFSRIFKKKTGITPAVYRQLH